MKTMIRLYTFLIFVAIIVVILHVFFVVPQPNYIGKTALLITPQTELIASDTSNITNNVVFVMQSALDNSDVVKNSIAKVNVVRLPGTSVVQFITEAKSISSVKTIENSAIKEALGEVSKHYDINKDFTMSVMRKNAIQKTSIATIAPYVVMVFVVIGLIAGLLALFYTIDLFRMKAKYDENIDGEKIFADYHLDRELEEEPQDVVDDEKNKNNDDGDIARVNESDLDNENINEIFKEIKSEKIDKVDVVKEMSASMVTSGIPEGLATTPGNLPVVDTSDFGVGESVASKKTEVQETEELAEPTEAELKARLNELLDGKL